MSEEQGPTEPGLQEPGEDIMADNPTNEEEELQMDDEADELHFESHPVEGTASPFSDTTPSVEEDAISFKGESVPKPFGSVATLDTIALDSEMSPTMENLDLGDTKSLDRECMHYEREKDVLEEASEEVREEDAKIDVNLGGENVALSVEDLTLGEVGDLQKLEKDMDGISLNDTVPAEEEQQEAESEAAKVVEAPVATPDPLGVHFGQQPDPLGVHNGQQSDPLGAHFGQQSDALGEHYGQQPDPLGAHFGQQPDPLGVHFGQQPDPVDVHFGQQPDPLSVHFGQSKEDDDRNKLSSYFASVPSSGDNIFDTIAETVVQAPEEKIPVATPTPEIFSSEPVLLEETGVSKTEEEGGDALGLGDPVSPQLKLDNVEESEPIEIIHQRHRNASASIETPIVSFEGEALKMDSTNDQSTVRQFFPDDTHEDKEGKEFFDHFTSEGVGELKVVEGQIQAQPDSQENLQVSGPEVISKEKRKPGAAFVLPHLSPGPSPNTSAYASPVHHAHATPVPTPNATPLHRTSIGSEKTPYSPQRFSSDMTGLPAFSSHNVPEPDDVFTASLNMNEADRQRDAWIPSELTRQTLVSMITSQPGTFYPKQEQLTMPGLVANDPQGDPVHDLLKRCVGEHEALKRQSLTADSVPQDEEGLRQLIRAECWRSAVDLTGRLLTLHGQGLGKTNIESKITPQTLQLWFVRTSLLMRLKLYSLADSENSAFGNFDKPDLFYEYYPDLYPGRKGSMVPFSFRVINAELPHFLGRSQESLDKLYYVFAIVKKITGHLEMGLAEDGSMLELSDEKRKASKELWEKREMHILFSIVNILVGIKTYDTAVDVLELLIKKNLEKDFNIAIHSGLGRLYMQMGDIEGARRYFDQVADMVGEKDKAGRCRVKMNKGFLALGQNDFEVAKNFFKDVVEMEPTNAVAVNNMAVCYLYMGKLKEALQILEDLVHQNPAKYLQEGILINLCTLYELESSRALHKKQALLELVSKYKGNGFNVGCLKMSELLAKK